MNRETSQKYLTKECEEILEELQYRITNSTSTNSNKTKFANCTNEQLINWAKSDLAKVIYVDDDRRDVYLASPDIQNLAQSVVSLIEDYRISDNGNGTSTILTQSYADKYHFCTGERFTHQPTAPLCSGFLVASDIVATAGHCINKSNLPTFDFVFGFQMIDSLNARVVIPNEDIYRGIDIVAWKLDQNGADYALVRIDRPVKDRPILSIRNSGKIEDGEKVFVIGCPSGLPLKYADGAKVNNNSQSTFFEASLDTYGGNSGSPVFNEHTHEVEGILVRGEEDYRYDRFNNCYISNQIEDNGVIGEDVTRTTEFADFIGDSNGNGRVAANPFDLHTKVDDLERSVELIAKNLEYIKNKI